MRRPITMSRRNLLHARFGSLAFAAALYALAWLLLQHGARLSPRLAAFPRWPVLFDFLLTTPAFSWWMYRYDRKRAWRSALGVAALGLLVAGYLIPEVSFNATHVWLVVALLGAMAAEGFLIVLVWRYAGRVEPRANPDYALHDRIVQRFGAGAPGRAVGFEARMWLHALWLRKKDWRYRGARHFSYHLKDGYAANLQGYLVLLAVGLPAQHLLLQLFSHRLAWISDGLTAYGMLFLLAHYRACQICPVSMDGQNIYLRHGLRVPEQVIALHSIVAVERFVEAVSGRAPGTLNLAGSGQPNVCLRLRQARSLEGMYGIKRSIDTIYLGLDGAAIFITAFDAICATSDLSCERLDRSKF
jgi:hypothetical protein